MHNKCAMCATSEINCLSPRKISGIILQSEPANHLLKSNIKLFFVKLFSVYFLIFQNGLTYAWRLPECNIKFTFFFLSCESKLNCMPGSCWKAVELAIAKRAFTWKPKLRKLSLNRRKCSEMAYNFELKREKRSIVLMKTHQETY